MKKKITNMKRKKSASSRPALMASMLFQVTTMLNVSFFYLFFFFQFPNNYKAFICFCESCEHERTFVIRLFLCDLWRMMDIIWLIHNFSHELVLYNHSICVQLFMFFWHKKLFYDANFNNLLTYKQKPKNFYFILSFKTEEPA